MFMKRNKHQGLKNLSTKTKVLKAAGGFNILTYIYITYWEREWDVIDMVFSSEEPGENKQRKVY